MNKLFVLALGIAIASLGLTSCGTLLHKKGLHPDYDGKEYNLSGKKALVVTTSHDVLNKPGETTGDPTGVFASEIVHGNITSSSVHNLTLGHSYLLTLAAVTPAGRGPFSNPVSLHVDPVLLHPLAKVYI